MTVSRRNVSASVRARPANAARAAGLAFEALLTLYMMERLLHRLSRSAYSDRFVLKGGFLLFGLLADFHRTASDMDLLSRHGAPELVKLTATFHDICGMVFDDGLTYDLPSLRAERIREGRQFEGVRVRVTCFLGPARKVIQLDIGFGDVLVPRPQQMVFPTILTSEESGPIIWAYTADSVVAEKFEAMVALATLNSRMKDFYDIFMLSDTADFDGRTLQEAVSQTLERRGTALPRDPPPCSTSASGVMPAVSSNGPLSCAS